MPITPMFPLEVTMLPGEELPLRSSSCATPALVADCLVAPSIPVRVVLIAAGREVCGGDDP